MIGRYNLVMKRSYVLGLGAVAAVVLVIVVLSMTMAGSRSVSPTPVPPGSVQTYKGKVICLPHKNVQGPQTLECAYGLETADGKKYGIRNSSAFSYDTNDQITIKGTVSAPEANNIYDIVGTISATDISKAQ